jgi:hypothetical protein
MTHPPTPAGDSLGVRIAADHLILLFIGSERTGSTLLGQLLNLHPACLVANESRLVAKVIDQRASLEEAVRDAAREALGQFEVGLERWGRFQGTNAKMQPRWRPMAGLSAHPGLAKTTIRVVGDKKAGAVSQMAIERPGEVESFVQSQPRLRLLHLTRDPIATARSACLSHGHDSLDAALEHIVLRHAAAHRLRTAAPDRSMQVSYESLCECPTRTLTDVAAWLGLDVMPDWGTLAASLVSPDTPAPFDPAAHALMCRLLDRYQVASLFTPSADGP